MNIIKTALEFLISPDSANDYFERIERKINFLIEKVSKTMAATQADFDAKMAQFTESEHTLETAVQANSEQTNKIATDFKALSDKIANLPAAADLQPEVDQLQKAIDKNAALSTAINDAISQSKAADPDAPPADQPASDTPSA